VLQASIETMKMAAEFDGADFAVVELLESVGLTNEIQ